MRSVQGFIYETSQLGGMVPDQAFRRQFSEQPHHGEVTAGSKGKKYAQQQPTQVSFCQGKDGGKDTHNDSRHQPPGYISAAFQRLGTMAVRRQQPGHEAELYGSKASLAEECPGNSMKAFMQDDSAGK